MSENQLNRQLAAGIRAAQQGNRERARELLEGVLRRDRNNEQAWIWMASAVESQRERRLSLERVLKINPNNRPAQDALNSMVGVLGSGESRSAINYAAISAAARTPAPSTGRSNSPSPADRVGASTGGDNNLAVYLFGGAIVLGILLAGSIFIPPLLQPEPTVTPTTVVAQVVTEGPTVDPNIPTNTPTIPPSATFNADGAGDIATNTPAGPTFTPTNTVPPSETPLPTATQPPLTSYDFVARGFQGSAGSSIYNVSADGGTVRTILPDVGDFDFNPDTGAIVFTRQYFVEQPTLTPVPTIDRSQVRLSPTPRGTQASAGGGGLVIRTGSGVLPDLEQFEMFLTNIDSPDVLIEITSSTLPTAFEPAISPDGNFVAFASDVDDDTEIFLYNVSTGLSEQITDNIVFEDSYPEWSPDGSLIIFSSDRISAGNNDLFTIDPFASNPSSTVEQITDSRGRNIEPQWSPDGEQIVYLNINGNETTIQVVSSDGRLARDVTFNPDWTYASPAWTQDGNYIVYASSPPDVNIRPIRFYSLVTGNEQTLEIENFGIYQIVPRQ